MFAKLKKLNVPHLLDLKNLVMLIKLIDSGTIDLSELSENEFIPCYQTHEESDFFMCLKVRFEGEKIVAETALVPEIIKNDIISAYQNSTSYSSFIE